MDKLKIVYSQWMNKNFVRFVHFLFLTKLFSSLHKKGIRIRMRGRYYSNGYYDCVVVYCSGYLIC